MKTTIAFFAGMIFAAVNMIGAEAVPTPVMELNLNGNLTNTGSGKFTAVMNQKAFHWGEGRNKNQALFIDNNMKDYKKRSVHTALSIPGGSGKFNVAEPFTITMWIMPDPSTISRTCTLLSTFSGDYGKGIRLLLMGKNTLYAEYGNGKKDGYGLITAPRGKFTLETGTWNHIAVTYNGKTCQLYLNGIPYAEKQVKLNPASASDISIGAFLNGYAQAYRGGISQIRFYKQALNGQQILFEARKN